jgi:hypothetical protein
MDNSKSKAPGGSNEEAGKRQSGTQSSSAAQARNTSATSGNSQTPPQSQIGFQATKPLGEPEETTNARLIVTFAAKLGALVEWRKIALADGREVYALCFPTNAWTTNQDGELVIRQKGS